MRNNFFLRRQQLEQKNKDGIKIYALLVLLPLFVIGIIHIDLLGDMKNVEDLVARSEAVKNKPTFQRQSELREALMRRTNLLEVYTGYVSDIKGHIDAREVIHEVVLAKIFQVFDSETMLLDFSLDYSGVALSVRTTNRAAMASFYREFKNLGLFEPFKMGPVTQDRETGFQEVTFNAKFKVGVLSEIIE